MRHGHICNMKHMNQLFADVQTQIIKEPETILNIL